MTKNLVWSHVEYQCGGSLTENEGSFTSPGYPDSTYPNNVECVWTITTNEGSRIAIDLVDFDVQYRYYYSCYYDYVKVSCKKTFYFSSESHDYTSDVSSCLSLALTYLFCLILITYVYSFIWVRQKQGSCNRVICA